MTYVSRSKRCIQVPAPKWAIPAPNDAGPAPASPTPAPNDARPAPEPEPEPEPESKARQSYICSITESNSTHPKAKGQPGRGWPVIK